MTPQTDRSPTIVFVEESIQTKQRKNNHNNYQQHQ